jgi:hypothetical protein
LIVAKDYNNLIKQIDSESLIKNSLQKKTIINENYFPKGMKVSKIFHKIMDKFNIQTIDQLYSSLLQTLSIEGNLCISIHPLDYLTMSDNSFKWSSCQSLQGEFSAGLLSLLTDCSTIVCYIESKQKEFFLNQVSWNNKKWRQLIHINPDYDTVIFNTQYPFNHDLAHNELINKLQSIISKKTIQCNMRTDIVARYFFKDINAKILHHNDLLCEKISGDYENEYIELIAPEDINLKNKSPIIVGSVPLCPVCGDYFIMQSISLECQHCNPIEYCCNCGLPFDELELHEMNEELFCDTCFDDYFKYCHICDELISKAEEVLGMHYCNQNETTIKTS